MKTSIDAAFVVDDNYYLEGVATAYSKLGLNSIWWEPSKKPYFDLLDQLNPKIVYYSKRGLQTNWIHLKGAAEQLNLKDINDDYSGLIANDLLYFPGYFDKFLESDALMIIKTQVPEPQLPLLVKLCGEMPKLKIISKKYIPLTNLIGECSIYEIRDAIASTKAIVDYDNTFSAVAFHNGMKCINLSGDILEQENKPKTFTEVVKEHVSDSNR